MLATLLQKAPFRWMIPANTLAKRRGKLLRQLSGEGIEIGALHRPVVAPHLKIHYVDRLPYEEILKQYPELAELTIVKPDIIADAELLETIPDESQDFIIANHVIEHMRNPIQALLNWQRVLKPGGHLFLAAPDKRCTFDRERPYTNFEHIVSDYENPSDARDYEAFQEFALEVSCKTFGVRPVAESEIQAKHLWDTQYSIHYHVWDFDSFKEFLRLFAERFDTWQMRITNVMPTFGDEFIFLLKK